MKHSLEVTDSSIKQTQMTSVNGYRGDECQNHSHAEKTKSSESKRTWRLVRNLKWTGRTRRRAKHRVETETNKAKIETKKDSEKYHCEPINYSTGKYFSEKYPACYIIVPAVFERVGCPTSHITVSAVF